MTRLKTGGVIFILAWTIHTADHIRRTAAFTSDGVLWAGTAGAVVAAVALTLIFTDHQMAAFATAVVFGALAFGVAATHLAPAWGYFSEPLVFGSTTDRWALAAAVLEICVATWLAVQGWSVLRANGYRLESTRR